MPTRVRRLCKVTFYTILSLIVGRTLGEPEIWVNQDLVYWTGNILYGSGEIGSDNFYDLYFYISVITIFSITTMIYLLTMILIKKARSK